MIECGMWSAECGVRSAEWEMKMGGRMSAG